MCHVSSWFVGGCKYVSMGSMKNRKEFSKIVYGKDNYCYNIVTVMEGKKLLSQIKEKYTLFGFSIFNGPLEEV